ncbi:MAG: hypothetical protein R3E11_07790 [Sphingobium sp.]|nr:hypothetical protein [Sphingobium sp.]MCP5397962.1 hypothetical protein [Sphingomonas sp.]
MTTQQAAMADTPGLTLMDRVRAYADSPLLPVICIALVLIMQGTMVFGRAINWDEFHFYRQVELFTQGVLELPLQTLHVRIFQWLPGLAGTGVDHIVIARMFMFACEMVTASGIILLAARFTDWKTGAVCVLAYLSSGFVMQHGFSFRTDPIITALTMSALCILGCTRFRGGWLLLFGAFIGTAAMFSIKIILWAPAFAGLAWWRWHREGYGFSLALRLAVALTAAALFFAVLYMLHSAGMTVDGSAKSVLQNSAQKMFFLGIPPYWALMLKFVSMSEILVLTILCFPVAIYMSGLGRHKKIALIGLFLPISVLGFYFNALPYFYAFLLPPVAVACAVPLSMLGRRYGAGLPAVAFLMMALSTWMHEDKSVIDRQRKLQTVAKAMFPQPISYFDFAGFLPWQDKANAFMTLWGMELYRAGNVPPMREVMQEKAVPLVVEMDDMFSPVLNSTGEQRDLLPEDVAALHDTYVQHWGPFWVPGEILQPSEARRVEIYVPGPYTLEYGEIRVSGRVLHKGDAIQLDRGRYEMMASEGGARLVWGDHLYKPDRDPPERPYWTFF